MLHTITHVSDVPRAQLDPITTPTEKLSVFALALSRPLRDETIALCCDHQQRGLGIFAFNSKLKLTQIIDRIIGAAITLTRLPRFVCLVRGEVPVKMPLTRHSFLWPRIDVKTLVWISPIGFWSPMAASAH